MSNATREAMIEEQLRARGIHDLRVLQAMRDVAREDFVGLDLSEFAYEDSALPIEEGQTISQPYMVALMTEALQINEGDRVLEIGTGSGYAAAVLSRVAGEVYTVERLASLAHLAAKRLVKAGYDNVHVLHGDGTLGWPEMAPFNAIVVAAGGPDVPQPLLEQLAIGGRLVIPTGPTMREQTLLRVRRVSAKKYDQEDLGAVRFVPLIGAEGWEGPTASEEFSPKPAIVLEPKPTATRIARHCEPIDDIEGVILGPLLDRIGDARVVLLGEASHGTAEFYDMRARITRELVIKKGFNFVAAEADWPDAAQIDHFVRDSRIEPTEEATFNRFPTWMWANAQVLKFVEWLRGYNLEHFADADKRVGFHGLDLYSLYASIHAVTRYLDEVDPASARIARTRYGCLSPWESDPATYGASAISGKQHDCEAEVVMMLQDMMARRLDYAKQDGRKYLDAVANARVVREAEKYYRVMYYGGRKSWNLRDQHMFDTLKMLLNFHGPQSKAVVWAHNSHLGDASATEMATRGEHNIGQLCRREFKNDVYTIGFGTHTGVVAAASDWGGPVEFKTIRPSHPNSYERLCHESGVRSFMLPLQKGDSTLRAQLAVPRLERAIGVIYRPETELHSHYFQASLPRQFDEYIWFDETNPVTPLGPESGVGLPETFPFGL